MKKLFFVLMFTLTIYSCSELSSKDSRKEYILENKKVLDLVVQKLLDKEWDVENAYSYLDQHGLKLTINEVRQEEKIVSFMIDGMLDNCTGIAYSRLGLEAHICGGNTKDWEMLIENWYFLNSI